MALPAFSTTSSCIHNDMHRRGGAWQATLPCAACSRAPVIPTVHSPYDDYF
jgi:hypothetical protein